MAEAFTEDKLHNFLLTMIPGNLDKVENIFTYDFNLQSNNSKDFVKKLKNQFEPFFQDFSDKFYKLTDKKLQLENYKIEEFNNPTSLSTVILEKGTDFYLRHMNLGSSLFEKDELIEYVSPEFVNRILLECNDEETQTFVKKTLANHFIFKIIENYFIKNSKEKITPEDYKLKTPPQIPYLEPVSKKEDIFSNILRLNNFQILALEFTVSNDDALGDIYIAGTKKAWLKYLGEEETPEKIFTKEDFRNHNTYGIFTSFNLSETAIENLKPGDKFLTENYDKYKYLPLIAHNKTIALGDIILDKNDITSLNLLKLFTSEEQQDYFENNPDNLFVLIGTAEIKEEYIQNPLKLGRVIFQTEMTKGLPLLYKHQIIGQVLIENYGGYPLIKIEKIYESPIPLN